LPSLSSSALLERLGNDQTGEINTAAIKKNFVDKVDHKMVKEVVRDPKEIQQIQQAQQMIAQKLQELQQREQHLERFGEVMQKLETRQEKVQERIENAVENAQEKIENFQNRKGEILEKIESKLPERIRFRIQGGQPGELLGGDKDEHGCIGSAGYTWCESKVKCLRAWEEACEQEQDQEQN